MAASRAAPQPWARRWGSSDAEGLLQRLRLCVRGYHGWLFTYTNSLRRWGSGDGSECGMDQESSGREGGKADGHSAAMGCSGGLLTGHGRCCRVMLRGACRSGVAVLRLGLCPNLIRQLV